MDTTVTTMITVMVTVMGTRMDVHRRGTLLWCTIMTMDTAVRGTVAIGAVGDLASAFISVVVAAVVAAAVKR